jgi:outer membrane protein assembly factor BamE (lipoprotein component of BamABCDE complex)
MIRHLAVVLAIALLAGCAATGSKLESGASRAEVEKTMGNPTETLTRANGDTLLYYSRLPEGRAIFVATIGPDGKLREQVEQRLTRRNVGSVKAGMQAKEVRELLGPPHKPRRMSVTVGFETVERDVWEYPWLDVSEMRLLWLQFSADGVLREKIEGHDDLADRSRWTS